MVCFVLIKLISLRHNSYCVQLRLIDVSRIGFSCCTVNMHQGWSAYTELFYGARDNGIAALVYAPSGVTTKVAGDKLSI